MPNADSQYINQGKCPCGCGKRVENNHYWATNYCGYNARRKGMKMPSRGEAKRRYRKVVKNG